MSKRKRTVAIGAAVLLSAVAIVAFATKPSALAFPATFSGPSGNLDTYLAQSEAAVDAEFGLVDGTNKRIRWQPGSEGQKTPLSVVYLHGFSATRQEVAPVGDMIADRLGANLFETRLTAHGLERDALRDVRAEDWLGDVLEAFEIGRQIGERVIVIGTSTGATLALAMLNHELIENVESIVSFAPNVVLQDTNSELLLIPGGPVLAQMILGSERSWEPKNEQQGIYWSTTYPTPAVIEMMRLVVFARENLPAETNVRLLTVASPNDGVVNTVESRKHLELVAAPDNEFVDFLGSTDTLEHVLAGDILSPESNQQLVDIVVDFVARP